MIITKVSPQLALGPWLNCNSNGKCKIEPGDRKTGDRRQQSEDRGAADEVKSLVFGTDMLERWWT
jgi:hypothetical protein